MKINPSNFFLHPQKISDVTVKTFSYVTVVALVVLSCGIYLIPLALANRKIVKKQGDQSVGNVSKTILQGNASEQKVQEPEQEVTPKVYSEDELKKMLTLGNRYQFLKSEKQVNTTNIIRSSEESFQIILKNGQREGDFIQFSNLKIFPIKSPCLNSRNGMSMTLNNLLLDEKIYAWEANRIGFNIYMSKEEKRRSVDSPDLITKERLLRLV